MLGFEVLPKLAREVKTETIAGVVEQHLAETHRHAGHADIVRELIDGAAGLRADNDNMAVGEQGWEEYRDRLERAAKEAGSA